LRGSGSIGFDFGNLNGEGSLIIRDFLKQLIVNVVKGYTNYYNSTQDFHNDHILRYKEMQLNGVLCPAIASITPAYLTECPCRRKTDAKESSAGHIDYWIYYHNTSFLLEVKHAHYYYKYRKNKINERFQDAIKQLKYVHRYSYPDFVPNNSVKLIKIALEAIVFSWELKEKKDSDKIDASGSIEEFDLIKRGFRKNKPDFSALWLLNKDLIHKFEEDGGDYQYPALAFIARIF